MISEKLPTGPVGPSSIQKLGKPGTVVARCARGAPSQRSPRTSPCSPTTRVAVFAPGAAHRVSLLEYAQVGVAGLAQLDHRGDAGHAGAEDGDARLPAVLGPGPAGAGGGVHVREFIDFLSTFTHEAGYATQKVLRVSYRALNVA